MTQTSLNDNPEGLEGGRPMKITPSLVAILMMGVLVFVIGSDANAQETSKGIIAELTKQLVQALPKELVQDIKKQFMEEIRKEVIAKARGESNHDPKPIEMSAVLGALRNQLAQSENADANHKLATLAKQYLQGSENLPQKAANQPNASETRPVERFARGDFIAVVTNQSNPVKSLTMDQIRKLFSGQYTNWNDVGGPDMEVKVLTWEQSAATLENLLKTSLAPAATRAKYVSLMIPLVDRSTGAIGFLPTRNVEQADFLLRHDAIKKIAIKMDDHSPAVAPSRMTLADGTYPMLSAGVTPAIAWSFPATAESDKSFATFSGPR
jgi:uncharacterized protein (DUF2267 family)